MVAFKVGYFSARLNNVATTLPLSSRGLDNGLWLRRLLFPPEIGYRAIHRWADMEGRKLREKEEARQQAVFGRTEKGRDDGEERGNSNLW